MADEEEDLLAAGDSCIEARQTADIIRQIWFLVAPVIQRSTFPAVVSCGCSAVRFLAAACALSVVMPVGLRHTTFFVLSSPPSFVLCRIFYVAPASAIVSRVTLHRPPGPQMG